MLWLKDIATATVARTLQPCQNQQKMPLNHSWHPLAAAQVSEGQKQWWSFKAANWNSVLLFKMGKFYEVRRP